MSIGSQLPPLPLAQASAMLRALDQGPGQNVEARVLGPLPGGLTQVQIGRQVMSLQLPAMPPVGATLTLAVQQAEGQVRVALVSTQPPAASPGGVPPPPPASLPATSVQLSAAALAAPGAPSAAPLVASAANAQPFVPPPLPGPGAPIANASPTTTSGNAPPAAMAAPLDQRPVSNSAVPRAMGEQAAPPVNAATSAPGMRPAIPYAQAGPAALPSAAAPMQGATSAVLPPVAQSTIAGNVGQHAPPRGAQFPANMVTQAPAIAPSAAPGVANPQAALTQMVQQALVRQDSVVGLTTALTHIVGRVALPEAVMKAAQQVLAQRLSLDGGGPDGAALQRAVKNSGIFQEAMLAGGQAKAAGGDMKTALLGLQRQLGAWLGDQPGVEQVRAIPPPLKGVLPRARAENGSQGSLPDEPELAGKVLLERTEAALSRLRLHQNASLPEPASRQEAQWSLDLPVVLNGQQSLLHIQIHRDRNGDEAGPEEDRGWQVRFAINLSDMGEVGAQVSLRGAATGVLLWAENDALAAALDEGVGALRQELEALSLLPGAIVVRKGAPNMPAQPAAASGHIVDAVR
ncbi:flagellar hook-length control protein FliK [Devosia faecipullorum]|uniref:flagellar hook-length control protein FliK n=1 Tax=Devosia faecipullorum TaxID=2755039 RepID=UPI00187B8497|nr:flagellar hook-length control protein FliK [Devosia faecipullorum]MBE7731812.1 flagellar hook-length control protein FliK [Devosia faecipullorum]